VKQSSTHKPGHKHYFQVIANPSKILPNSCIAYSKPVLIKWKFHHNQLYAIHHKSWNTWISVKGQPEN